MKKSILNIVVPLLLLVSFGAPAGMNAASQPPHLQKLMTMPDSELLKKGEAYSARNANDSALVCYTIIVSRYDNSMSEKQKINVVNSYERLWNIYFILYSDYTRAYECLDRAQKICDEIGVKRSRMYIMYGVTYQVIYNLYNDLSKYRLSYKYYLMAFRQAKAEKNENTMTLAYCNLVLVAFDLNRLSDIAGVAKEYASYPFKDRTELVDNNILTYDGLLALGKGDCDGAIAKFTAQLRTMPEDLAHVRFIYNNYLMLSRAEQGMGNYDKAQGWLHKAAALCSRFDVADLNAELYNSLYKCFKTAGRQDSALYYRGKFLECKDKAMDYRNMQSFARMGFQSEINYVTRKISEMKAVEKFHRSTLVIVSVFLAVFVFMSVFIFMKNRRLAASFKSLYQKNVELLRIKEQMEVKAPGGGREHTPVNTGGCQEKPVSRENAGLPSETKRSRLGAEEYAALRERIKSVMKDPDIICAVDFSVEQLVSAVEAKYKTVLEVIHDEYGYNFSSLLNKCRIEEACRRITEDAQVRNYTVEAIARQVGYRSRTSFTTAFKKVTGLYPSEYIRLSREK